MSQVILFNKPCGVLCQFSPQPGVETLADYIDVPGVYPAGRLDADSEGLLVLTDDGPLQARVSHPRHKLAKTYWVQVEGEPDDDALAQLRRGVVLKDGPTLPAEVERLPEPTLWPRQPPIRERRHIPTRWLRIVLREGRNRQVRRMTAAVGFPTLRLVRVAVGPWHLDDLGPGNFVHTDIRPEAVPESRGAAPRRSGRPPRSASRSAGRPIQQPAERQSRATGRRGKTTATGPTSPRPRPKRGKPRS